MMFSPLCPLLDPFRANFHPLRDPRGTADPARNFRGPESNAPDLTWEVIRARARPSSLPPKMSLEPLPNPSIRQLSELGVKRVLRVVLSNVPLRTHSRPSAKFRAKATETTIHEKLVPFGSVPAHRRGALRTRSRFAVRLQFMSRKNASLVLSKRLEARSEFERRRLEAGEQTLNVARHRMIPTAFSVRNLEPEGRRPVVMLWRRPRAV